MPKIIEDFLSQRKCFEVIGKQPPQWKPTEIISPCEKNDQQDCKQERRDGIPENHDGTAPDIKTGSVSHRFADAERDADKINGKGAPDPEGNRNRHLFQNQVRDFPVPEKTFAKIKNEVVPEHLQETDMNRFIESVHSLDFLNQLWIEPLGTTVF